jgi:hypothetical protein
MKAKTAHPETRSPTPTAGGLPGASQGRPVDLLAAGRRDGVRGVVRGLSRFTATVTPIDPTPGRRKPITDGAVIEVQIEGRSLGYGERSRLLDFAAEHMQ